MIGLDESRGLETSSLRGEQVKIASAVCASLFLSLLICRSPAEAQSVGLNPPALPPVTREFGHVFGKPLDPNADMSEALALLAGGDHVNLLINVTLPGNYGQTAIGGAVQGQVFVTVVSDEECAKLSTWAYGRTAKEICVKLVTAGYVDPQNRAVQAAAVQAVQDVSTSLGTKIDAQSKTLELLQKRIDALERARPRR